MLARDPIPSRWIGRIAWKHAAQQGAAFHACKTLGGDSPGNRDECMMADVPSLGKALLRPGEAHPIPTQKREVST
jgi:hypothetical protein